MSILVSLTPAESKRLIGIAVAKHPIVQKALYEGNILVSNGTTTGYFIEEVFDISLPLEKFPSGVITQGVLCQTPKDRIRSIFIQKGKLCENNLDISDYDELDTFWEKMSSGDVYIKGANAFDSLGNAGFLLAHPEGGNVMKALPKINAQNIKFIIPVGLEKLVMSVSEAQKNMKGVYDYSYTFGRGCGYATVCNGIIINEIVSIQMLTGAKAIQAAAGGVGGSEGSVVLVVEGTEIQESDTVKLLQHIKGERALPVWKETCAECVFQCKYRFPIED